MKNKELYSRIYKLIKPHKLKLIGAMLCMIMVAALSSAQAYMVKPLLDEIFFNKNRFMLNILPFALILLFLIKGIFFFSYSYLMGVAGQTTIKDMRIKIFRHIHGMGLAFFNKMPTGELISRIMGDVNLIQRAMSKAIIGVLRDCFQVVGLIAVIFYQDWQLALLSIVFIPMAVYPIVTFGRKYRKLSIKNQKTRALVSTILHETITGNRIVKAFCMEDMETKRFSAMIERLYSIVIKDVKLSSMAHPIMEMLGGLGTVLIIWYGGSKVLNGVSTPGTFFSFLTALIMIYEPIKGVSKVNNSFQKGIAACIRVFALLDMEPDIKEQKDAVKLPPVNKSIEIRDVSFGYKKNTRVLKNINLTVKAGEVIAIVGPSGCGKTTLVNLLPRFYNVNEGKILIDGHDIRKVTLRSLRGQISIVSQETILFNDTVGNNIAYGAPGASGAEIIAAARAAHALDFINKLPKGLDTEIGEGGLKISGGQRQRISIARAILKNAPVLILDEATSALDSESEREVQSALEYLMKNRTTFIVAHRLSTVKNANRIIVMQKGRIVEEGDHDTLLNQNGVYKMLYSMQF